MKTRTAITLLLAMATAGWAADLKPIHTAPAQGLTVALLSETGQWTVGKNAFVLTITKDAKPVDAGKVSLSTSMPMPGMAPMIAGATLTPEPGPGRYRGTIDFPDRGARQVTVTWDGPAGKGAAKFSVPVR